MLEVDLEVELVGTLAIVDFEVVDRVDDFEVLDMLRLTMEEEEEEVVLKYFESG